MKKLFTSAVFCLAGFIASAQFVYKIKADSVLITNDSCSAELILENGTKNVKGFLYNYGNGRTRFQSGLLKIDDTTYVFGGDTLKLSNGNFIKNQYTSQQTATAWFDSSKVITSNADTVRANKLLRIGRPWFANNFPLLQARTDTFTAANITAIPGVGGWFYNELIASQGGFSIPGTRFATQANFQVRGYDSLNFSGQSNWSQIGGAMNRILFVENPLYTGIKKVTTTVPGNQPPQSFANAITATLSSILVQVGGGGPTNHYKLMGHYASHVSQLRLGFVSGDTMENWAAYIIDAYSTSGKLLKGYGLHNRIITADSGWYLYNEAPSNPSFLAGAVLIGYDSTRALPSQVPNSTAILDLNTKGKGFLAPRMNTAQQNAIISPATALLIYNTDSSKFRFYNGAAWVSIGTGGGGGGSVTADNGLTANTSSNVRLGGTLLQQTNIDGGSSFSLTSTSSVGVINSTFNGLNTGAGNGIFGSAISGTGVTGVSTSGPGISASSTSGIGINVNSASSFAGIFGIYPSSTNTTPVIVQFQRQSSGTAANGIGQTLELATETSDGSVWQTNQIISKWTNATTAARTSQFEIHGVNNGVLARKLAVSGSGQLILDNYTSSSSFTGTAVASLAVDASGNVITTAPGGGGGSSTLAGLTDANISSPSSGQFLQYQTSDNKWHNYTLVGTDVPNHDASKITTGTIAPARLGSGTADNTTYLGGDQAYHSALMSKAITMVSPTASENVMMFYTDVPITISKVAESTRGTSPSTTYNIKYASDRSTAGTSVFGSNRAVTSTTGTTTTTFASASIPAGSYVWVITSATTGTVNDFNVTITYRQ